ncbi:MAG: glycerophosphodiester phosphodiesterase family protein [bacterium]
MAGPTPAFACAHRGLSGEKPENTLAAFGAAVAAGFPAVELDLRTTKDGQLVILHDASLERTTDGRGRVETLVLREVQDFDAGGGPVPRLEDLVTMLRSWDGLYNLELKSTSAAKPTVDVVRQQRLGARVQISSMDPKALAEVHHLAPEIARGLICLGPPDDGDVATAQDTGCTWINVDHDFIDAPGEVAAWQKAGLRVAAWTVNDAARAKALVAMGVRCIITDMREVGAAVPGKGAW